MGELESKIVVVTVYPDRARVTRRGVVTLDAGAQSVILNNLPRGMDLGSVRAAGKGNARLIGVQTAYLTISEAAPGSAKEAQDKLQGLMDRDKILADEAEAWAQRLTVIKAMGESGGENFARSVARGKMSLEGVTAMLDYLSQSHEAANSILRDLGMRRRELAKEIEAAKQEADKLQNAASRDVVQAQVNLDVNAAGDVEIELSYTVYGASWNAVYDARLQDASLEWNYLAQVRQQTGENWDAPYTLALSTATLATGLDKPELVPWRVDVYRPPQPRMKQMRRAEPMMAAAPAAAEAYSPPPMQDMASNQAEVESSAASVTYKIAVPRSIPSDGEPQQVTITTLNVPVQIDYFCAPKVDAHAFVRASFTNPSDYLMLAGQVNLYHGADFVGTRNVETIVPHQDVEFFLGAEERIDVERKEVKRTVDKSLLGNKARTTLGYKIHIQNPALDTARITVLDQIPVSAHPDISVKVGRVVPDATPNDQGELEWTRELKRGETVDLELEVTVEYPKEMRVVGL